MNRIIDICMRLKPDEIYRKPYQPEAARHYPEMRSLAGPRIPVVTHLRTVGKPRRPVGTPPKPVGNHPRPTRTPPKPAGKQSKPAG